MRARHLLAPALCGLALAGAAGAADKPGARGARVPATPVSAATRVDHDGRPAPKPAEREQPLYAHQFREAVVEPLSHAFDVPDKILWLVDAVGGDPEREAVNVNVLDEVPNSTWFTNRNHVRALSPREVREGPGGGLRPTPPYELKSVKKTGVNPGFNMKDGAGKRWVVKLDRPGYPQLASGAEVVVSRLLWAAGYNLPHDEAFTFARDELKLDEDLQKGEDGEPPFGDADLDSLLARGERQGGRWYAHASQFIEGEPIGPIPSRGRRPDDTNDRFTHQHRRELRGLYVLNSWVGNWDTKEHQSFDSFVAAEGSDRKGAERGHVRHYLLDVGGSLGAGAQGPKPLSFGYEYTLDWGWMMKRLFTLGFAVEPWRAADQESGIPSAGNFESREYEPDDFRMLQPHPAFRERTKRDGYWGAKLVASFSDAQIRAAVAAAGYEDPRAAEFLTRRLIERRDKVARHWFERVAPVDFFEVQAGRLRFRDLAVDRGLEAPRGYEARVRRLSGGAARRLTLATAELPLAALDPGAGKIEVLLSVRGRDADPARLELEPKGGTWIVTRVRHE